MNEIKLCKWLYEQTGLEKIFETVYGNYTVTSMFSGKVISRALHCHFLVVAALRMKFFLYQKQQAHLLPATSGINEKLTQDTTNQHFSNETSLQFREPLLPKELDELKILFYTLGSS